MCLELMNVKFGAEAGHPGPHRPGSARDPWNWVLSHSPETPTHRPGCLVPVCEVGLGGTGIAFSSALQPPPGSTAMPQGFPVGSVARLRRRVARSRSLGLSRGFTCEGRGRSEWGAVWGRFGDASHSPGTPMSIPPGAARGSCSFPEGPPHGVQQALTGGPGSQTPDGVHPGTCPSSQTPVLSGDGPGLPDVLGSGLRTNASPWTAGGESPRAGVRVWPGATCWRVSAGEGAGPSVSRPCLPISSCKQGNGSPRAGSWSAGGEVGGRKCRLSLSRPDCPGTRFGAPTPLPAGKGGRGHDEGAAGETPGGCQEAVCPGAACGPASLQSLL